MTKEKEVDNIVEQVRKYSRHMVRELDVVKGSYMGTGCTFTQCHVLFELATHESMQLMQLSEILLIDKSNTSRTVKKLIAMGLVKSKKVATDNRQKLFSLTAAGRKVLKSTVTLAHAQVESALENLSDRQQAIVVDGLRLYAQALECTRKQAGLTVRAIEPSDNHDVAELIREVMTEFGAVGEGYSIGDAEVDEMFESYRSPRHCYFVIENEPGEIVGGGGIGQLKGGGKQVCELRKMFFFPAVRGIGMGRKLLMQLLDQARAFGYKQCYLETLDRMPDAIRLYVRNGFKRLDKPMGDTGHCSCDHWYLLDLSS